MARNTSLSPEAGLLLLTLSFLWGGSFLFVGIAVKELPPLVIVACRVSLAALALIAVVTLTRSGLPRGREVWLAFLGMGLINNVIPHTLIVWGQTEIASGLASILNGTTPLFTVLVAHALTADERLAPGKVFGLLVGFAGVVLMIGLDALRGIGDHVLAQLAVLGAAVSYAFAVVYARRFRGLGVTPIQTATGQVTMSSLVMLPVVFFVHGSEIAMPSWLTIWSVVALALASTALAYILYFRIIDIAGATNAALVTFLIPVSAILLGYAVLGEVLQPKHFAGIALIFVGLAAIDGRSWAILSRRFALARP